MNSSTTAQENLYKVARSLCTLPYISCTLQEVYPSKIEMKDTPKEERPPRPVSCRIVEGGYFFTFDDGTTKFIRHCASYGPEDELQDKQAGKER